MIIDIIFIVLMLMAIIKGYSRGLIVAVFSLLAFIIGVAAALKLSTVVAGRLDENFSLSGKWMPVISFLIVFLVVVILVRLGAKFIEKTFQLAMLGWANRIAGIIMYIALYTVLFSIGLFYAVKMSLVRVETIAASVSDSFIEPWGPRVIGGFGQIVPIFRDMFTNLETFFDNMAKKRG